jgi:hypothetical protein
VDIRYEIAEKRAAESVVTLDEETEHAYLLARTATEATLAVQAAVLAHARERDVWTDDVTIGIEVVPEDEQPTDD